MASPPKTSSEQPSSIITPKRKRGHSAGPTIPETPQTPHSSPAMRVNTNLPVSYLVPREARGNESPRTKVAYNFQGLQLSSGDVVSGFDLNTRASSPDDEFESQRHPMEYVRKRMRVIDGTDHEIPEGPKVFTIAIGPERRDLDPAVRSSARNVQLHNHVDPAIHGGADQAPPLNKFLSSLGQHYSISRAESQPRGERSGTPPLFFGSADATDEAARHVIDFDTKNSSSSNSNKEVDQASLTWHANEITGHTMLDPDDDGTGINGVGFKPTPAMAAARAERRRQQLADYKSREAREARNRRSERRKAQPPAHSSRDNANRNSMISTASAEEIEAARRVRFLIEGNQ